MNVDLTTEQGNSIIMTSYAEAKDLKKLREELRPQYGSLFLLSFIDDVGHLHQFFGFVRSNDDPRLFSTLFKVTFACPNREVIKKASTFTFQYLVDIHNEVKIYKSMHAVEYSALINQVLNPSNISLTLNTQSISTYVGLDDLDEKQKRSIIEISQAISENETNIFLIEGPPGTGKTRLLVNLLYQLQLGREHKNFQRILVCAPSNAAVDVITNRLLKANKRLSPQDKIEKIRYGHVEKMDERVKPWSLDKRTKNKLRAEIYEAAEKYQPDHPHQKERQKSYLEKMELERAQKGRRKKEESVEIHKKLKLVNNAILAKEEEMYSSLAGSQPISVRKKSWRETLMNRAHVVCSTLGSSPSLDSASMNTLFDILIIDEATVATEYQVLAPLRYGVKHLILIGDTKQLPVLVKSKQAKTLGLERSLFERIEKVLSFERKRIYTLETQYRMHPDLLLFPSQEYYSGRLKTAETT